MSVAIDGAWVARPRPNPSARLRLICLPYAGGGASAFRRWPEGLPTQVELCSVQLPGREARLLEPSLDRLPDLVRTLADALHPDLVVPFALFGHSMGALVAFELARHLRCAYELNPEFLFVSGRRAPQLPDPNPPIHELPEPTFIAELRRLNGTPEEVLQHRELVELLLPSLRADFALCETYTHIPDRPLECPISVCGGLQDPEVRSDELAAWHIQTSSSFTLRLFEGDHFYLHSARAELLQALLFDLRETLQRCSGAA